MAKLKLNIIDFLIKMNMVEPGGPSLGHRAFLKSFYGLELDQEELNFYYRATGRTTYVPREQKEVTAITGRRAGKTRLAVQIALYEAVRHKRLPRGGRAFILIIAPVLRQAQIAFDYVRDYVHGAPELMRLVVAERRSEIEFRNGITIRCEPCSSKTIRAPGVVCAICDELGYWNEETAADSEREVMEALRPTMATFPNAKLIKISSPGRREGILFRNLQERESLSYNVWQAGTRAMNPTVSNDFLEAEKSENEEYFRREYLGEFVDSLTGWITPEMLDPSVIRGQRELPRVSNGTYVAACDPAFRSSDFGFAILHHSDDGNITVAYAARWIPTHNEPLNFGAVSEQIKIVLERYGMNSLVGDQYCFAILRENFQRLGIYYREFSFGAHTRASIYGNLRQLITQLRIRIVDEPELLRQLRCLEQIIAPNGNIDIRPPRSSKDDMAIAAALGAFELSQVPERSSFSLGIVEYAPEPLYYDEYLMRWAR